jgi:hypothetical protein
MQILALDAAGSPGHAGILSAAHKFDAPICGEIRAKKKGPRVAGPFLA